MKTFREEDCNYTVYKHTNKTNGKIYIGVTKRKPEDRWKNGNGYTGMRFKRAIDKYGWDGFDHQIVFEHLSRDDAFEQEKRMIKEYDSANPVHGYNHALGGEGGGMYNIHHTEEAKQKIREARLRDGFTEEHKKHISESKTGIKHHMAKPVYQYSINGELLKKWDYMSEAAKVLGISKGNISRACHGHCGSKTCGGFIWTYDRVE